MIIMLPNKQPQSDFEFIDQHRMRRLKKLSQKYPDEVEESESHWKRQKQQPELPSSSSQDGESQSQSSLSLSIKKKKPIQVEEGSNQEEKKAKDKQKRVRNTKNSKGKDREAVLKKADEILRKMQDQYAENDSSENQNSANCVDIPDYAIMDKKQKANKGQVKGTKAKNKFFDLRVEDPQQSTSFNVNNCNGNPFHNELQQIEKQYQKAALEKDLKNIELLGMRKNKLQERVDKIRSRLQFKNSKDDDRFKEHIKQKLEDVKDCEEVNLKIQAPKIFKGSSAKHTDGALYLKNLASQKNYTNLSQDRSEEKSNSHHERTVKDSLEKNKKIDRNMFFEKVGRDLKDLRAVEFDNQKITFNKSSFDDLQMEFDKNQHLFKENYNQSMSRSRSFSRNIGDQLNSRSNSRISQQSSRRKSHIVVKGEVSREKDQLVSNEKSHSKTIVQRKSINNYPFSVVKEQRQNEESNKTSLSNLNLNLNNQRTDTKQQTSKAEKKQKNTSIDKEKKTKQQKKSVKKQKAEKNGGISGKSRQKKQRKPKNQVKKEKTTKKKKRDREVDKQFIKSLFDQQAEDSGNDNYKGGESSDQEDKQELKQLIEEGKVELIRKNQRLARKKFLDDQHAHDMEVLRKIKEKILKPKKIKCDEDSESRKRRERRINQARKRFQQQDGETGDQFLIPNLDNLKRQIEEQKQNRQIEKSEFEKHLLELQGEIELKKQKQKNKISLASTEQKKTKKVSQTSWKDIKSVVRVGTTEKRGGFGNNTKAIAGAKLGQRKSSQGKKKKEINIQ